MKRINRILTLGLIITLVILPLFSADLIIPGTKQIGYCAKITNIDEFPDYFFLLNNYGPLSNGYLFIEQDKCISLGYKFSSTELYAIKKSKFNEDDIDFTVQWNRISESVKQEIKKEYKSYFDKFDGTDFIDENPRIAESTKRGVGYTIYFNYNDNIINLNADINRIMTVGNIDPLSSVTESFKIIEENETLSLSKSIHKTYSKSTLLFYLLSFIALISLIYIIIKNRRK